MRIHYGQTVYYIGDVAHNDDLLSFPDSSASINGSETFSEKKQKGERNMSVARNGFTSGAVTRTFIADSPVPGWEIRGTIQRAAEVQGSPTRPDVTISVFATLVDQSLVDESDRDYSSGTRTSRIPGGNPSIPGDGEDTSDAAAEARFYELADQIASELPTPSA